MIRDTQPLLENILQRRDPLIPLGNHGVLPYYDGASLINLPAAICHWLDIPMFGAQPLSPHWQSALPGRYQRAILLLVDGLGYNLLQSVIAGDWQDIAGLDIWAQFAATNPPLPLTSVIPSTTAAALTSLWTATPPLEHGMLAYEVWLKEYGVLANMLSFNVASAKSRPADAGSLKRSGFDPDQFIPLPTFGSHLMKHGVQNRVMQHTGISRSDLSHMLTSPAEVLPFRATSDLWVTLAEQLHETPAQKQFTYVYWGVLDELMHFFGPRDERVLLELAAFSQQLRYFLEKTSREHVNTLLLLTADHGQIATPNQPDFNLEQHPQLWDCLSMPPSGESRLPILFVHPRKEERLLK
ncbi:MAG: hypothetical protein HPY76_14295, partial [Anaerolineae bacterium]|nr:hypothetical protein [Anaerolineae bacterium]